MKLTYKYWLRYLTPLILALFLAFLLFMLAQFREPPAFRWYGLIWFCITILLMWEAGWLVARRLDRDHPWNKNILKRLTLQLLLSNLLGTTIFIITYIILNSYENFIRGSDNPLSLLHLMVTCAFAFIFIQIINSIQIGYQLIENAEQTKFESEELIKNKAVRDLENIRQQLDQESVVELLREIDDRMQTIPKETSEVLSRLSTAYKTSNTQLKRQLENIQSELKNNKESNLSHAANVEVDSKLREQIRFLVRSGSKMMVVPVEHIAGFYKDDLVFLVTQKGKKYVVDRSLEDLSLGLSRKQFFRINRQCIVNIASISEARTEGSQLELTMVVDFPKSLFVSQRNISRFKKWWVGEGE